MTQKKLDSLISFVFWLQNVFKFLSVSFFFFALAPQGLVHTAWTWQPLLTPELTARSTSRCAHNKVGKNWSQLAAHPIHHFMPETQTGVTPSAWRHFFTEAAPLGQNPLDWHKPPSAQRVSFFVFFLSLWMLFISQTKIYISYQVSVRRNETDLSWNVSHYQLVDVSSGSLHINPSFGKTWWSYLDANMSLWTPTYPKRHDKHNHPQHEQMNLNVLLMDGWWVSFPKSGLKKKTCGAKKLNMSIK